MAPPVTSRTRRQQETYAAVKKYRARLPEADVKAINRWHQFLVRAHLTHSEIEECLAEKFGYRWLELFATTRSRRDEEAWKRLHRCQRLLCYGEPVSARIEAGALEVTLRPYIEKDLDAYHIWIHCLEILRDTGDFWLSPLVVMLWRAVERRDPRNFIKSLIMDATIRRKVFREHTEALRILKGTESGLYPKRHQEGFVDLYREAIGAVVRLIARHYRDLQVSPLDAAQEYVPDLDFLARDIGTTQANRETLHEKALILMACDYVSRSYLSQAEDALIECLQQPVKSPYHEMSNLRAEIELCLRQKKILGAQEKIERFFTICEEHPSLHDLSELQYLTRESPSLRIPPLPPVTPVFPGVLLVRLYEISSMAVAPMKLKDGSESVTVQP